MLKAFPIFKKNGTNLVNIYIFKNIKIVHSQSFSVLKMEKHFWFVSNFENVTFEINGKNSPKKTTIQTIMLPLRSFKRIKMQF